MRFVISRLQTAWNLFGLTSKISKMNYDENGESYSISNIYYVPEKGLCSNAIDY
jgi:hypothetical protein